jgi:hypothetical protein
MIKTNSLENPVYIGKSLSLILRSGPFKHVLFDESSSETGFTVHV